MKARTEHAVGLFRVAIQNQHLRREGRKEDWVSRVSIEASADPTVDCKGSVFRAVPREEKNAGSSSFPKLVSHGMCTASGRDVAIHKVTLIHRGSFRG